ncbi:MAG TPA: hypothetical protein VMR21_10830, partial [Vicinamibacteria bacterium]|nr:hypothetical protein [Vicinamibacteria bacterium]
TEDLPSRPSSVQVGGPGSIPVIVIPVPQLTPAPVPSPSSPNAPAPNPNPTPRATPTPGEGGGGGSPHNNNSPTVKLNANVYFVECNGQALPNSSRATTAPVGCRVHLDCTARDASNAPTTPRGTPRWTYSNLGLLHVGGNSPFNPVITAKGAGSTDIYAEVDGVRSATFSIRFE